MKFEKMKEIRENKELKQWQIANELKVDRSTYAGWETGKDTIPLRKLYELSNYYKISIDYITGLSKKNNYIYSGDSIDLNRVAKNLRKLRIDNNLKTRIELLAVKNNLSFNKMLTYLIELGYNSYMEKFDKYYEIQNKKIEREEEDE